MIQKLQNVSSLMDKAWFENNIWPGWSADKVSKSLEKNNVKIESDDVEILLPKDINVAGKIDELSAEIKSLFDTKKIIEDKAKTILGSVAVAVTAVTFAINNQNLSFGRWAGNISLFLLTVSILNFIMATIRAIQALNVAKFYFEVITRYSSTEDGIQLLPKMKDEDRLKTLFLYKLLNENNIVGKSNYAFAGFVLLRNGIISFTAFFLVALINKKVESPNSTYNESIRLTVPIEINTIPFSDTTIVVDTLLIGNVIKDSMGK